jgi:hypothetical protein
MLILAPRAAHASMDGKQCDYWTWIQRGWCRLECMAYALSTRATDLVPPLLVQQSHDISFCSPFDSLTRPIGCGSFRTTSRFAH